MKKILSIFAAFAASISIAHAANNGRFIHIGAETSIPIGGYQYCMRLPSECPFTNVSPPVHLDKELVEKIVVINSYVNANIIQESDKENYGIEEYWTIPNNGIGDCEDIALLKKKMLQNSGIPLSDLLITVVKTKSGEGHAVLTVRTDKGDVVLDNLSPNALFWNKTPYTFVKIQSPKGGGMWVDIISNKASMKVSSVK